MKALFTLQPALSHLHPLLALARALVDAGHEVAFATSASFGPTVEGAGFRCFAAGVDWQVSDGARTFPELAGLRGEALNDHWFRALFAGATPSPMVRDLEAIIATFAPEVIVRDLYEFGGALAAERAGLPHATHAFGHYAPTERMAALVGGELAAARRDAGLSADDSLGWLYRYLYLDFVPAGFQLFPVDQLATAHALRPATRDHLGSPPPAWLAELSGGPTAYITLGTVFNRAPSRFRLLIQGLRPLCRNLIVTVGDTQDPAALATAGLGVHVVQYLPQSSVLPRCDLVASHGGFNTIMGALAHGVPLLCLPMQADQPYNASRVAALGLGVSLESPTVEQVFAAARALLADPQPRARAAAYRDTLSALPAIDTAVALVERLAVERRPILRHSGWNSEKPTRLT